MILTALGRQMAINDEGSSFVMTLVSAGSDKRPGNAIVLFKIRQPIIGIEDLKDHQQRAVVAQVQYFRLQNKEELLGNFSTQVDPEPDPQPTLPGTWDVLVDQENRGGKSTVFPKPNS